MKDRLRKFAPFAPFVLALVIAILLSFFQADSQRGFDLDDWLTLFIGIAIGTVIQGVVMVILHITQHN